MTQRYETLLLDVPFEHVLTVTLNRPAAANALNTKMAEELAAVFGAREIREYRCVVITGSGERAFCAGADLKQRNGMSDAELSGQRNVFVRAFRALTEFPMPLVAAVNGAAYGGGCEIALACDFIYAAAGARFALTETSLGLIPGGGATQTLARAVGIARAKEIILGAAPFTAEDAAAWGMVNKVCEVGTLMPDVLVLAKKIAANAPLSLAQAKKAMRGALGQSFSDAYVAEIEAYDPLIATEDRREGIRAFNEKRAPKFTGR